MSAPSATGVSLHEHEVDRERAHQRADVAPEECEREVGREENDVGAGPREARGILPFEIGRVVGVFHDRDTEAATVQGAEYLLDDPGLPRAALANDLDDQGKVRHALTDGTGRP